MKYTLSEVADLIEKTWGKADIAHWLRTIEYTNHICQNCFHALEHHLKNGCDRLGCDCKTFDNGRG